jgi:hypothetical protein
MPVAITLATIALLRGGTTEQPFFDADLMRGLLSDGIEDTDTLRVSLVLTEELDSKLQRYRASIDATIDAYVKESRNPGSRAENLIERLAPLDQDREEIMRAIIDYRRQLIEVLDDKQWNDIFR